MDATAWWMRAFGQDYQERYRHRSDDEAAAEVMGLLPRLREAPGPLLDACCGNGRHLQAFREAGLAAFGFDWSLALLRHAAGRPIVGQRCARGDMRQPPLASGWGAITMLFTAFGYFDDADNAHTLQAMIELLTPGGWLVVDCPQPALLRAQLVPKSSRQLSDGTVVEEERWFDGPRVCKRSRWLVDGEAQEVEERVRLYEAAEIAALATAGGGRWVESWPSLRGPGEDQGRLVHWIQRC